MSLRESMLTREIEDLNNKLTTKSDELNETMKRYSEVCMRWVVNAFKQSWMIFYLVIISKIFIWCTDMLL